MRYLLDTNAVSDLVRDPHGVVGQKVRLVGDDAICTSVIVAAEARYGAERRGSTRLLEQLETVLSELPVLPFEAGADRVYAQVRTALEAAGTPIGANDLLIAAHAISLGCVVVTDNEREFRRVEGLPVENWRNG